MAKFASYDNVSILIVLLLTMMFSSSDMVLARPLASSSIFYDVTNFGAVGDGRTDDTNAFLKTWEVVCKNPQYLSSSIVNMIVPSGKTFLVQPLYLHGPCNSEKTNVEINGVMYGPSDPNKWKCRDKNGACDRWIHFKRVDGLSIYGSGTIGGNGQNWWKIKHRRKPAALVISHANNINLSGLTLKNNPRVHIVLSHINTLHVSNILVNAPGSSKNSDGIHISECNNVIVDNCVISTGDDCISIVKGSSNLRIKNIICGPGHGISIGSLGRHGAHEEVENVHVSDVVFVGSDNGARIKTWPGGSGFARNISFERILSQGSRNPIIIDQYYCDHEYCVNYASAVKVSNITFREVFGFAQKKVAVVLDCSSTIPCTDITLENINLRQRDGSPASYTASNVFGRAIGHRIPQIPLATHA